MKYSNFGTCLFTHFLKVVFLGIIIFSLQSCSKEESLINEQEILQIDEVEMTLKSSNDESEDFLKNPLIGTTATIYCLPTTNISQFGDAYSLFAGTVQQLQDYADFKLGTPNVYPSNTETVTYYQIYSTSYIPFFTNAPSSYTAAMQSDIFHQINANIFSACGSLPYRFNSPQFCPNLHPGIIDIHFEPVWIACGCPESEIYINATVTYACP